MSTVCAIDPGTTQSAYVLWDGHKLHGSGFVDNHELRYKLATRFELEGLVVGSVAIEMIASYGMPVGRETFETVLWIGRFIEVSGQHWTYRLVYRLNVKTHLCHSAKAKDGNVRQALIDKHGIVGTKKNPGPLYGVSGHLWAALAVADYALCVSDP